MEKPACGCEQNPRGGERRQRRRQPSLSGVGSPGFIPARRCAAVVCVCCVCVPRRARDAVAMNWTGWMDGGQVVMPVAVAADQGTHRIRTAFGLPLFALVGGESVGANKLRVGLGGWSASSCLGFNRQLLSPLALLHLHR